MANELWLHSPAGGDPVVYHWPLTSGTGSDKHDGAIEIIETLSGLFIRFLAVASTIALGEAKSFRTAKLGSQHALPKKNSATDRRFKQLVRSIARTPGESADVYFRRIRRRTPTLPVRYTLQFSRP
ncbi:hypothetical protein J437_LFUL005003 [Ladona fulva]|uniref:Uncharacterized protein n=1 Tax=Ladona fulva TaxID=123851 RepID=A0A8K0JU99_LADFU|nr:hypothetical protein J437_LFUL005003 [Ladona fulva]